MMRPPVSGPPAVPSGSSDPARRSRALARLLDESLRIPGTRIRVGLDPILGLVPGLGDVLTTGVATLIVLDAARLGAPPAVLGRMAGNILADAAIGAIPVAGDVLDVFARVNTRNLALLDRHLADPAASRRTSRRFLWLIGGVGIVVLAALLGLSLMALRWLLAVLGA
jgi:Domain of unknown function (DUF4112)